MGAVNETTLSHFLSVKPRRKDLRQRNPVARVCVNETPITDYLKRGRG